MDRPRSSASPNRSKSSAIRPRARGMPYRRAKTVRFSLTVRFPGRDTNGEVKFTRARIRCRSAGIGSPSTCTRPDVGSRSPSSIASVVVFPAPLGPRNPTISPARTWNERSSTTTRAPNRFVRCSTLIAIPPAPITLTALRCGCRAPGIAFTARART